MARSRKAKKSTISIDFTGVETSGNIREGRQLLTIVEAELKTSESSGNDYINFKIKGNGGNMYHTCSLQAQALFNLRGILEAAGQEVPDGPLELDLDELVGLEFGGEVEHELYQGKKKGILVDTFPVDELDEETTQQSSDEPEDEDEDEAGDEDVTFEDVQEMDKEELLELAEEYEIKVPKPKQRKLDTLRDFICDELELEEAGEAGESELTADDINEMDIDELKQVADDAGIKVLARVKKSVNKFRAFLIEELELEEAGAGSDQISKGTKVKFDDEGETMTGKVKSVNEDEGFAVVDVDGEDWEIELEDLEIA